MVALAFMWTEAVCVGQSVLERSVRSLTNWVDTGIANGTTYSVIVEANNPRPSAQFADKERVQFFSRFIEGDVVSVQHIPHLPEKADGSMISAQHLEGVDRRVRMVFVPDWPRIQGHPDKVSYDKQICCWFPPRNPYDAVNEPSSLEVSETSTGGALIMPKNFDHVSVMLC